MTRLPELKPEDMDEKQRAIVSKSGAASRGGIGRGGSFAMLFSPEFAERAQSLNEYVLKKNAIGRRLTELAVLATARHLSSRFEWWAHARVAEEHGIKPDLIEAIRNRREPAFSQDDERITYDFSVELLRDGAVKPETFERAMQSLGIKGVVDLIGVLGCYTMLAMFISTFELEPPEDTLGT